MRTHARLWLAPAIGAAFGAVTAVVDNIPRMQGVIGQAHSDDGAVTWTAIYFSKHLDTGWSWAALGFLLGLLSGAGARPARAATLGAVASAVGLVFATVGFYGVEPLVGTSHDRGFIIYWLMGSVVCGLPLGVLGATARRRSVLGLIAALTIPVGAATQMVVFPLWLGLPGESSADAWAQATVWVGAIMGAAFVVVRYGRSLLARRHPDQQVQDGLVESTQTI
ncbi:hypothetical protein ODJ79_03615 [Actinoplanes sp. KI2]|uniref:DUF6518 family protein n=1 Tax=Actinoplanes sp. KI2 TaxID=2983315 RepID=UPI0021D5AB74|nr:hypothetical protein [Actinoplanes sp. KI2]MCU7722792.1 hypothetical protein [Actinoplanes sp. KI2]